jgi:hypothetical protein
MLLLVYCLVCCLFELLVLYLNSFCKRLVDLARRFVFCWLPLSAVADDLRACVSIMFIGVWIVRRHFLWKCDLSLRAVFVKNYALTKLAQGHSFNVNLLLHCLFKLDTNGQEFHWFSGFYPFIFLNLFYACGLSTNWLAIYVAVSLLLTEGLTVWLPAETCWNCRRAARRNEVFFNLENQACTMYDAAFALCVFNNPFVTISRSRVF